MREVSCGVCEESIFALAGLDSDIFFKLALKNVKQIFFNKIPHMTKYFVMRECEDSYMESLCCDSALAHKKEFYIFKFPDWFLAISSRDLTSSASSSSLRSTTLII